MKTSLPILLIILSTLSSVFSQSNQSFQSLEKLADDFWRWRAEYAPFTGDDVNRMERPGGLRDWSKAAIEKRRKDLAEFEARWKKIDASEIGRFRSKLIIN